jgi:dethiobiotin synthetase
MSSEKQQFKFFISGIGTDVGKTVVSTILTTALEADYWKPIQSGDLDCTDTMKVQTLVTTANPKHRGFFHSEIYQLNFPLSPHISAEKSNISIDTTKFQPPKTNNHLIIEGAGGLLVPITRKFLVADLIKQLETPVIIVSRHYLGSINHTLMTIESLQHRRLPIKGIIFNGEENSGTESVITDLYPSIPFYRIPHTDELSAKFISHEASRILPFINQCLV